MSVNFLNMQEIRDEQLSFAVIICQYQDKHVFVRHHERKTLESPGGHREMGETIEACARRELIEETGALDFQLTLKSCYKTREGAFGALYVALIKSLGTKPDSEIAEVMVCKTSLKNWTYPEIQPILLAKVYPEGADTMNSL